MSCRTLRYYEHYRKGISHKSFMANQSESRNLKFGLTLKQWIRRLLRLLRQMLSCTCNFSFSRTSTWVKWIDNGLVLISHGPKTSRLQKSTLVLHARLYLHNLQAKKFETLLYLKTIELEKVQSLNRSQTGKKNLSVSSKCAKFETFKGKISFLMFKFSRAVCLKNRPAKEYWAGKSAKFKP